MGPKNNSLEAISSYISEYIDPMAALEAGTDAAALLAELDKEYADEGGTGLTVEQMQRYLDALPRD